MRWRRDHALAVQRYVVTNTYSPCQVETLHECLTHLVPATLMQDWTDTALLITGELYMSRNSQQAGQPRMKVSLVILVRSIFVAENECRARLAHGLAMHLAPPLPLADLKRNRLLRRGELIGLSDSPQHETTHS